MSVSSGGGDGGGGRGGGGSGGGGSGGGGDNDGKATAGVEVHEAAHEAAQLGHIYGTFAVH